MRRSLIGCALLTAALSTQPVVAHAATLQVATCANAGERTAFSGGGYIPGAAVQVQPEGAAPVTAVAGPDGGIAGSFQAPLRRSGDPRLEQPFHAGASDGTNAAAATFLVVRPEVTFQPRGGTTGGGPLIRGRGFAPNRTVWAHVRRGRRWIRTRKITRASGPCGTFRIRRRVLSGLGGSQSLYVQFDQRRRPKLSIRPAGWLRVSVRAAVPGFSAERYYLLNSGWRGAR